jgi:hypothetical protein
MSEENPVAFQAAVLYDFDSIKILFMQTTKIGGV